MAVEESVEQEVLRFRKVVDDRTRVGELLDLFRQLEKSVKFSRKEHCFAVLVEQCVTRIPDDFFPELLERINKCNVVKRLRAELSVEEAEGALRPLVRRLFDVAPDSKAKLRAFFQAEELGISDDRGHTLALLIDAGLPLEELGDICDATVDYYEGLIPRAVPTAVASAT